MMGKAVLALAALGFCSFAMNAQTPSNEGASTSAKTSSSSGPTTTDRAFVKKAVAGWAGRGGTGAVSDPQCILP